MGESLIISDNPRLNIALGAARPWLVAVALTTLPAEFIGHTTESNSLQQTLRGQPCPGVLAYCPHSAFASQLLQHLSLGDWSSVPQEAGPYPANWLESAPAEVCLDLGQTKYRNIQTLHNMRLLAG
jgi:hypothetical protein